MNCLNLSVFSVTGPLIIRLMGLWNMDLALSPSKRRGALGQQSCTVVL